MSRVVRYYDHQLKGYLCFHHAIVMGLAKHDIDCDVEREHIDGNDGRDLSCKVCQETEAPKS